MEVNERMPRQERGHVRRSVILEASARVFDEVGYGSASLSGIAREAGVGQGSIYFYFQTKEAIALAVIEEQNARTFTAMTPPDGVTSPIETLIRASRGVAELLLTDPVVRAGIRLSLEQGVFAEPTSDFYEQWISAVTSGFLAAREVGELTDVVAADEVGASVVSYFTGVQLVSNVRTGREDLFSSVRTMWLLLVSGAVTEVERGRLLSVARDTFPS